MLKLLLLLHYLIGLSTATLSKPVEPNAVYGTREFKLSECMSHLKLMEKVISLNGFNMVFDLFRASFTMYKDLDILCNDMKYARNYSTTEPCHSITGLKRQFATLLDQAQPLITECLLAEVGLYKEYYETLFKGKALMNSALMYPDFRYYSKDELEQYIQNMDEVSEKAKDLRPIERLYQAKGTSITRDFKQMSEFKPTWDTEVITAFRKFTFVKDMMACQEESYDVAMYSLWQASSRIKEHLKNNDNI